LISTAKKLGKKAEAKGIAWDDGREASAAMGATVSGPSRADEGEAHGAHVGGRDTRGEDDRAPPPHGRSREDDDDMSVGSTRTSVSSVGSRGFDDDEHPHILSSRGMTEEALEKLRDYIFGEKDEKGVKSGKLTYKFEKHGLEEIQGVSAGGKTTYGGPSEDLHVVLKSGEKGDVGGFKSVRDVEIEEAKGAIVSLGMRTSEGEASGRSFVMEFGEDGRVKNMSPKGEAVKFQDNVAYIEHRGEKIALPISAEKFKAYQIQYEQTHSMSRTPGVDRDTVTHAPARATVTHPPHMPTAPTAPHTAGAATPGMSPADSHVIREDEESRRRVGERNDTLYKLHLQYCELRSKRDKTIDGLAEKKLIAEKLEVAFPGIDRGTYTAAMGIITHAKSMDATGKYISHTAEEIATKANHAFGISSLSAPAHTAGREGGHSATLDDFGSPVSVVSAAPRRESLSAAQREYIDRDRASAVASLAADAAARRGSVASVQPPQPSAHGEHEEAQRQAIEKRNGLLYECYLTYCSSGREARAGTATTMLTEKFPGISADTTHKIVDSFAANIGLSHAFDEGHFPKSPSEMHKVFNSRGMESHLTPLLATMGESGREAAMGTRSAPLQSPPHSEIAAIGIDIDDSLNRLRSSLASSRAAWSAHPPELHTAHMDAHEAARRESVSPEHADRQPEPAAATVATSPHTPTRRSVMAAADGVREEIESRRARQPSHDSAESAIAAHSVVDEGERDALKAILEPVALRPAVTASGTPPVPEHKVDEGYMTATPASVQPPPSKPTPAPPRREVTPEEESSRAKLDGERIERRNKALYECYKEYCKSRSTNKEAAKETATQAIGEHFGVLEQYRINSILSSFEDNLPKKGLFGGYTPKSEAEMGKVFGSFLPVRDLSPIERGKDIGMINPIAGRGGVGWKAAPLMDAPGGTAKPRVAAFVPPPPRVEERSGDVGVQHYMTGMDQFRHTNRGAGPKKAGGAMERKGFGAAPARGEDGAGPIPVTRGRTLEKGGHTDPRDVSESWSRSPSPERSGDVGKPHFVSPAPPPAVSHSSSGESRRVWFTSGDASAPHTPPKENPFVRSVDPWVTPGELYARSDTSHSSDGSDRSSPGSVVVVGSLADRLHTTPFRDVSAERSPRESAHVPEPTGVKPIVKGITVPPGASRAPQSSVSRVQPPPRTSVTEPAAPKPTMSSTDTHHHADSLRDMLDTRPPSPGRRRSSGSLGPAASPRSAEVTGKGGGGHGRGGEG